MYSYSKVPDVNDRRRCVKCDKPIPLHREREYVDKGSLKTRLTGGWRYGGYGNFCTLRCGCAYANKIVNVKKLSTRNH